MAEACMASFAAVAEEYVGVCTAGMGVHVWTGTVIGSGICFKCHLVQWNKLWVCGKDL